MPLTLPTPPTAPSLADPTNFDTRTDAFLAWMSTLTTTWNADPPYIEGDTIVIGAGTALLPSLTKDGDLNSGVWFPAADTVAVSTAGLERMRVDAVGDIAIGSTTAASHKMHIAFNNASSGGIRFSHSSATYTNPALLFVNSSGSTVGSVMSTLTATTYNTSSDYRLKKDIQPIANAADRVMTLNPVNFAWKLDDTRTDGFLAHELGAAIAGAATGHKDAMKDEEYEVTPAEHGVDGQEVAAAVKAVRSVPDMQGIDQSKVVPLLTAALQEALTRIATLEDRLTVLENSP